jgi:hypothetical protein
VAGQESRALLRAANSFGNVGNSTPFGLIPKLVLILSTFLNTVQKLLFSDGEFYDRQKLVKLCVKHTYSFNGFIDTPQLIIYA